MNTIVLYPPDIGWRQATFRWRIEPQVDLYEKCEFSLRFPEAVDISRIPERLWWSIMLICLHSQWPLLRPCRVSLPIKLWPGEAEFWSRLMEAEAVTLEAHYGSRGMSRRIEIVETGNELPAPTPLADNGRCATAFSAGKDSFVQAGLLSELTAQPILVTTTSPVPWLDDHRTKRRRQVLDETPRRRDLILVEVESDYRANFRYFVAPSLGRNIDINPISDAFLFAGATLAVAYAFGAPHTFLAGEAEIQETMEDEGEVVQHLHYMYSVATQEALNAHLKPYGLSHGSLISPLHRHHLQTLFWTRYPDLCDLQYSCWELKEGELMCNRCEKCLILSARTLAMGGDPDRMGTDWISLWRTFVDWKPKPFPAERETMTIYERHFVELHAQVARDLALISPAAMAWAMARHAPWRLPTPAFWQALRNYRSIYRRAKEFKAGPPPGYRPGYLKFVDSLLRDRVAAIYAEHFSPADESSYANGLARIERLVKWMIEPLLEGELRNRIG